MWIIPSYWLAIGSLLASLLASRLGGHLTSAATASKGNFTLFSSLLVVCVLLNSVSAYPQNRARESSLIEFAKTARKFSAEKNFSAEKKLF